MTNQSMDLILPYFFSMFNLELLQKYGPNAWPVHNFQLESYLKQIKQETERYRNEINEINRERKYDQVRQRE
jgi:pre-mRNA-splicing factor SPF27